MKMPEPVAWTNPSWLSNPHAGHYSARKTDCFGTPLYTKQALIDMLEAAAAECESAISLIWDYHDDGRKEIGVTVCNNLATNIRKLKETL